MTFRYLTVQDLIDLGSVAIEGEIIVRNRDLLESAAAQPTMTAWGEDLYPDLAAKAAAMWVSIDHNQPFMDGNKRTCVVACETFVILNGRTLAVDNIDLYEIAMRVADGDLKNQEDLAEVLRRVIV